MSGGEVQFQDKKSSNLIEEFQQQLAKEEQWRFDGDFASFDHTQRQAQTKKGRILSQKITGLRPLVRQVKAQGIVVAADRHRICWRITTRPTAFPKRS